MSSKENKRELQAGEGALINPPSKGPLTGRMIRCDREALPQSCTRDLSPSVRDVTLEIGKLLRPKSRTYMCRGVEGTAGFTANISSKILGRFLVAAQAVERGSTASECSEGKSLSQVHACFAQDIFRGKEYQLLQTNETVSMQTLMQSRRSHATQNLQGSQENG
jgi:hypothetical protein